MLSDDPISVRFGATKAAAFDEARRRVQVMLCADGYEVDDIVEVTEVLMRKGIHTRCATTLYKVSRAVLDGRTRLHGYAPCEPGAPLAAPGERVGPRWTSLWGILGASTWTRLTPRRAQP